MASMLNQKALLDSLGGSGAIPLGGAGGGLGGPMPQDQVDAFQREAEAGGERTRARGPVDMASQGWGGATAGNAGIAPGETSPNQGPAPILDDPLVSPTGPADAPKKPTNNFGSAMGLDEGKFNDPNKHDFKYDTMRVLSRFDPKAGFSPEVINALNSELGGTYGNYSGGGDKLSLSGAKGAKDAADFANQDWIYAHKAGNDATKWNFGGGGAPDPTAGGGAMGGLPPELGGDPMAQIQAALAKYQGKSPNIEALLAQLGGGQ